MGGCIIIVDSQWVVAMGVHRNKPVSREQEHQCAVILPPSELQFLHAVNLKNTHQSLSFKDMSKQMQGGGVVHDDPSLARMLQHHASKPDVVPRAPGEEVGASR